MMHLNKKKMEKNCLTDQLVGANLGSWLDETNRKIEM